MDGLHSHSLCFLKAVQEIDHHIGSGLAERQRSGATDPPTRACN